VPAEGAGIRRLFAVHPGTLLFDSAILACALFWRWRFGESPGGTLAHFPLLSVLGLILLFFFTPWYAGILHARTGAWDAAVRRLVTAVSAVSLFALFALMYSRIPRLCAMAQAGEKIEAFSMVASIILFAMGCLNGYLARDREVDRLRGRPGPEKELGVDQVLASIIVGVLPMFYLFLDNPWQATLDKRGLWGTLTGIGVSALIFLGGIATVILVLGLQAGFGKLVRPLRRLRFLAQGEELFFPPALAILFVMACAAPTVVGRGWFEGMAGSARGWTMLALSGLLIFRAYLGGVMGPRILHWAMGGAAIVLLGTGGF